MNYKVIHIVLTIEQQEPTQIRWWTEVPRDCKQFLLLYWWHPSCSPFVTTTFIILCHISNSYFWLNMVTSKDDQTEQRSRDSEQQCAKNNTNLGKKPVRWRYIVNAYTTCIYRLGKHHNMLLQFYARSCQVDHPLSFCSFLPFCCLSFVLRLLFIPLVCSNFWMEIAIKLRYIPGSHI
jgi:hypothetical protein